jgi:hypothetical protein
MHIRHRTGGTWGLWKSLLSNTGAQAITGNFTVYGDIDFTGTFRKNGTEIMPSGAFSVGERTIITSGSGTYTTPAGAKMLIVEGVAGGGAGGSQTGNQGGAASGGNAGGYANHKILAPNASYAFSIGAAGSGGSNGGNTTFGGMTLFGGKKGIEKTAFNQIYIQPPDTTATAATGVSGIHTTGDFGQAGIYINAGGGGATASGGAGGSSPFGSGGAPSEVNGFNASAGKAASGYGSGGSGGVSATSAAAAGGNGKGGLLIVTAYF